LPAAAHCHMPKRARARKTGVQARHAAEQEGQAQQQQAVEVARPPEQQRLLDAAAVGLPALICLGIYIYSLAPTTVPGDSSEFIASIHGLGIPHPTGYPLYMLLGKMFESLIPFGGVAYRINLFSAVCAAVMVGLLSLLTLKVTGNRAAATIAGFVGGLNESAWSQAVIAEVYALHGIMVMLVFLALLKWEERRTWRAIAWLGLVTGFGLTHHRAILFIAAPALIAAVALQRPFMVRGLIKAVGAGLAPLAIYAYLPIRAAAKPLLNWGNCVTWQNFWYHVMAKAYMHLILARTLRSTLIRAFSLVKSAGVEISWPGLVGAIAGGVLLIRRRPVLGAVTAVSFVTLLLWNSAYKDVVVIHFHLPTFLIMGLWLGVAVDEAQRWVRQHSTSQMVRRAGDAAPWIVLPALVALLMLFNFEKSSRRGQWELENWPRRTLAEIKPNAFLSGIGDTEIFVTWYMQAVHGLRRDITVLQANRLADVWYIQTIKDKEIATVMAAALLGALGTSDAELEKEFADRCTYMLAQQLADKRHLYTYHPPYPLPEGVCTLEHAMGLREFCRGKPKLLVRTTRVAGPEMLPGLMLVRVDVEKTRVHQLEPFRIMLGWRCERALPPGYTVGVRFQRAIPGQPPLAPGMLPPEESFFVQVLPLNYGQPLKPTPARYEYRQSGMFVAEAPYPPGKYHVIVGIGKATPSGRWTLVPQVQALVGGIEILPARKGAL